MADAKQSVIDRVAEWLLAARHAVVFTGAGISTESGIPDFRSPGGVWAKYKLVYYHEFLSSAEARRNTGGRSRKPPMISSARSPTPATWRSPAGSRPAAWRA